MNVNDPSVIEGEGSVVSGVGGVEVREVAQQDAQGVAQAAVGFRETRELVLAEGHLVGEIHARHPQAHDVRAILVDEVLGLGRFAVLTLL